MNAGAYGGEIKHVLKRVRYFENGKIIERDVTDEDLGYRKSSFSFPERIVISGELALAPDTDGNAKRLRDQYNAARREKQPLTFPSAGSTFKRPPDNFAGSLIEKTGLKGFTVGGAQVSEKHAGFIINIGSATANDVITLIQEVKRRVFDAHGVELEPEIKMIGKF
jgi:UDP-N-acetylmuramate dehydrogenase